MLRAAIVVAVVLASTVAGVGGAATVTADSAQPVDEQPMLHVDLTASGDATVTLVSVYDLTDDDERAAFQALQNDTAAQDDLRQRYQERMASVAEAAGEDPAVVTDPAIELNSDGDTGVVRLSVTWEGLAAVNNDTMTVSEPFASGYDADRPVVITAPEGATVESVTPEPDTESETRIKWEAGTEFTGMNLTFDTSEVTNSTEQTSESMPGFGVGVAVLAVVGVSALAVYRRE